VRVRKNGIFLFGISFFRFGDIHILYFANEGSDEVIGGSTKTAQHSIKNNSSIIKAVFFKLGTSTYYVVAMLTLLQSLSVKNQISLFATF